MVRKTCSGSECPICTVSGSLNLKKPYVRAKRVQKAGFLKNVRGAPHTFTAREPTYFCEGSGRLHHQISAAPVLALLDFPHLVPNSSVGNSSSITRKLLDGSGYRTNILNFRNVVSILVIVIILRVVFHVHLFSVITGTVSSWLSLLSSLGHLGHPRSHPFQNCNPCLFFLS